MKVALPAVFGLLGFGFYQNSDFMEIAAGIAIFLFGMIGLERGFRTFSGGLLERLLNRCTNALYKSLCFGIVTTTLMQSSSLVSVIAISFLSSGMIGLKAGLGIIFGANLGTTTGAWLVAGVGLKVKIAALALPMLVFGIILVFQRSKAFRGVGYILAGLGFLFLGIHHMKHGFDAFKSTIDLAAYAIPGYRGLFVFSLIGIVATVVMQSSHATLVLVITALASGQITYENALALAIGANIGTTITAILGAMSANTEGKRLAGGHLIFNTLTGLIAIAFIHPLAAAVAGISDYVGIPADDYSLRLAVFHTLFNLIGVAVMVPWIGRLVRLLTWLLPVSEAALTRPRYLNETATEFPGTAVKAIRNETDHLLDNAFVLLAHGIDLHRGDILSTRNMAEVIQERREPIEIEFDADYERTVKVLYAAIVEFASKARAQLTPEQGEDVHRYRIAARHIIEAVKSVKHLRKNLIVYINSDNPHIREAYNDIRITLGNVIREIMAMRQAAAAGEGVARARLDELRLDIQAADVLASGTLDELIRADLITGKMASSLMNDSSYRLYAVNHLVAMVEALYEPDELQNARTSAEESATADDPAPAADLALVKPRYLQAASIDDPATAVEAVRLEAIHLYDRASAVLSRAIGLEPELIHSDTDLAQIVMAQAAPVEFDIDDHYEKAVKVLYAEITLFVSKARTRLSATHRDRLLSYRSAARELVEAVKCVKHLRKNLSVYLTSDNEHLRRAYREICLLIVEVMRGVVSFRRPAGTSRSDTTTVDRLKQLVRKADILANGTLDELVHDDLITPWMATSLMNDSAYAGHACTHLINMAESVFLTAEPQREDRDVKKATAL